MKFTIVKDPIPFLIIDDTYNQEEQKQIYNEIEFLMDKLQGPEQTGSAVKEGTLKTNKGLFLDEIYAKREISNILNINRKLFYPEIKKQLKACHYAYECIDTTNMDTTLLSYYGDNDSYFKHKDHAVLSIITWFYKKPKNFTGGEFKFNDFDLIVDVVNNRSVIFFSSYSHEVAKVNLIDKTAPNSGRFTLTTFCNIVPRYDN